METVADVLEHCKFLISKGRGAEPGKLFLPRIERQRRKANKEGYKRLILQMDEQLYRDWHTEIERYVEACFNNPHLAYAVQLQILAAVRTELIHQMAEADRNVENAGEPEGQ